MFRDKNRPGSSHSPSASATKLDPAFVPFGRRTVLAIFYATLLSVGIVAVGVDLDAQPEVSTGISLTTQLRVSDTAGWWPTKGSAAKEQYVGSAQCTKCHAAKAASFENAAMAHAAVRAGDSAIADQHDSLELQIGPYHYELQKVAGKAQLKVSDAKASLSMPLEWGFGNGRMGQTYIYEQNGSYYESHVSFYVALRALDPGNLAPLPVTWNQLGDSRSRRKRPNSASVATRLPLDVLKSKT
jgi:hypothetical protein